MLDAGTRVGVEVVSSELEIRDEQGVWRGTTEQDGRLVRLGTGRDGSKLGGRPRPFIITEARDQNCLCRTTSTSSPYRVRSYHQPQTPSAAPPSDYPPSPVSSP